MPIEEVEFLVTDFHFEQWFSINNNYRDQVARIERRRSRKGVPPSGSSEAIIDEMNSTKFHASERLEVSGPLRSLTCRGSRCKQARFALEPEEWNPEDLNDNIRLGKPYGPHQIESLGFILRGVRRGAVTGRVTIPRRMFTNLSMLLGRGAVMMLHVSGHDEAPTDNASRVTAVRFTCIGLKHATDCGVLEDVNYACDCGVRAES